tara:strand:- start:403 stop:921 length:519 start_codon:yes stop_codon:yes gene_type:complete
MGKESDLYDPFNTKTLGGELRLDIDTYENIQDVIHLEGVNRKLLELTDLIGRVTNNRSSSGPIPDTQKIVQVTQTSDVGFYDIFKPDPGEIWKFVGGDLLATGGTAQVNFSLTDGSAFAYLGNTSVSGQEPLTFDNLYKLPDLLVSNTVWIGGDLTTIGTSARVSMCFIRVR